MDGVTKLALLFQKAHLDFIFAEHPYPPQLEVFYPQRWGR
jgi:hypothetical protein